MYRNKQQRANARQLRKEMTDAERKLWAAIRREQLSGYKFRRQAAIEQYIVDFVCFEARLIVELDGGQHNEAEHRKYDERRTGFLMSRGFRVLRYWNHDVIEDVDAVVEAISLELAMLSGKASPSPSPSPQGGGE